VEDWAEIRQLHLGEGMPIKAIARRLKVERVSPAKTGATAGPDVRRQAWEWATANRAADGSLPSGKVIADRYGRHERWGRLVKSADTGGEFTGPAADNNHRQPGSDRPPRPAAG